MDLTDLIAGLSEPSAYPDPVDRVEVRQTHLSVVFLTGEHAYKLKKPVEYDFVDLTTIGRRRSVGRDEVDLNQRLAPGVYEGVVPVVLDSGRLRVGRSEEPEVAGVVDWLVRMRRLPEKARLSDRLASGERLEDILVSLACRLASHHNAAPSGPEISAAAGPGRLRQLIRDNLAAAGAVVGRAVHPDIMPRLRSLLEHQVEHLAPMMARRADLGRPREGHGDLRLDHVYHFPDRSEPGDFAIVDCIEFDRRLRQLDPVCDAAFLAMELSGAGRPDLATWFMDAYLAAAADPEGHALVPLYSAYRATVRAKVMGLAAVAPELPEVDRERAMRAARHHWLLALGFLEVPDHRPLLLLVGGLPGAGKSTLARELVESGGFTTVLRSDVVRRKLPPCDDRYGEEPTARVYAALLSEAETRLFAGERVAVDASFARAPQRSEFLHLAVAMGVPCRFVECQIDNATARRRLRARVGDASEANHTVRVEMARRWEPYEADPRLPRLVLKTQHAPAQLARLVDEWLTPGEQG